MERPARILFGLYIIRHPSSTAGEAVGNFLYDHFRFEQHQDAIGPEGMSIVYRTSPGKINWNESGVTAVVVLMDECMRDDPEWLEYAVRIMRQAESTGLLSRCFPVMLQPMECPVPDMVQQALPWHRWPGGTEERKQRLACDLMHEFSRMLWHRTGEFRAQKNPDSEPTLEDYLATRVQVFLSHTKHDQDGEALAQSMRSWLDQNSHLSSFFDTHDIPPGTSFRKVLLKEIDNSAVMVLHTDSYSSRGWCRREVIEAKRRRVPMIVVNCLRDRDPHSVPYMGNTPVIRMSPDRAEERFRALTQCLLEEVFRTYLWRYRVGRYRVSHPDVLFLSRAPELLSLASLGAAMHGKGDAEIVYPNAPMSVDEARLFTEIAPQVRPLTLNAWLEKTS